ncbi:MAG TPA: cytochrome b [Steroidobacteraceae bacterium]|nr:cytochrome b [Steroidobacteraceae bacterium]
MQIRNTTVRWGALSQFFHWTIVALIIVQWVLAEVAEDLPLGMEKFATLARHKSIGITILTLVLLRLLWRLANPTPELPVTLKPYQRRLAHLTHYGLYVLLFAQPISGWIMSSAANFPVSYFGLFTLPDLVQPDKQFAKFMEEVHHWLFRGIVSLALLHIFAALYHHFRLKDDVLRRMLPFGQFR